MNLLTDDSLHISAWQALVFKPRAHHNSKLDNKIPVMGLGLTTLELVSSLCGKEKSQKLRYPRAWKVCAFKVRGPQRLCRPTSCPCPALARWFGASTTSQGCLYKIFHFLKIVVIYIYISPEIYHFNFLNVQFSSIKDIHSVMHSSSTSIWITFSSLQIKILYPFCTCPQPHGHLYSIFCLWIWLFSLSHVSWIVHCVPFVFSSYHIA